MSSRIEIEITSKADPKVFTWRALGAREPKGTINSEILPADTKVGDSFRVEADFLIDGIDILRVLPKRDERKLPETLEVIGSGVDKTGVTTSLVKKKRGNKKNKSRKSKNKKPQGKSKSEDKKSNQTQPVKSVNDKRRKGNVPRGKRLKAKRTHRNNVIADLPELHKELAREILIGGIPKLRKTLKQMKLPDGFDVEIIRYAEKINSDLKTAEWHDRADAVFHGANDVDLRDFRSVVAASGQWARTEEHLELKAQLEASLKERVQSEHEKWLSEIDKAIADEKSVRALNLSSHPPKPGTPLPDDLSERLISLANRSLNSESTSHRWGVVAQAVAYSPIRLKVVPDGTPDRLTEELKTTVQPLAERIPTIAKILGVENPSSSQTSQSTKIV